MEIINLKNVDVKRFLKSKSHFKFIFFDTETTGTSRIQKDNTTNQLLQISAIAYDLKFDELYKPTFNEIDRFDEKVRLSEETMGYIQKEPLAPKNEREYEFWLKTTRMGLIFYTHYDIQNCMSFVDENTAISNFENFVKKFDDVILVAHNAPFDVKWLKYDNFFTNSNYMVIDTCEYFNNVFFPNLKFNSFSNEDYKKQYDKFNDTKKNKKSVKLKNLIEGFNNDKNKFMDKLITHHNALTDCEMTKDVFEIGLRMTYNSNFLL